MTAEQMLQDYFDEEEMRKVLGIALSTLRNRINSGKDHPPFFGKGKARRFPKAAYLKWTQDRLVHQKNR